MQAGNGWAKVAIKKYVPGGQDGGGNQLPGTYQTILETRCNYTQVSSQVTIEAFAVGTNEIFQIRFRRRQAYQADANTQRVFMFDKEYSIIKTDGDRRDHILTIINRK